MDRQFWFLVLLMYCFSQIASKKSGCLPDDCVDCDNIIIFIYSKIFPLSHGLKTSVPERPIGANPGLKFCSTILYLPSMHCLE